MKREIVIGATAGFVALTAGFFCARFTHHHSQFPDATVKKANLTETGSAETPTLPVFDGDYAKWLDEVEKTKPGLRPSIDLELTKQDRIQQWIIEDPDAAFSFLSNSETESTASFTVLRNWLLFDIASLLQRTRQSGDQTLETQVISTAAQLKPSFFLQYVREQSDVPKWLAASIPTAIEQIAKSDPETALHLATEFAVSVDTKTHQSFVNPLGQRTYFTADFHSNLIAIAAQKNPHAALEWAQAQSSPELRRTTTETALATWAIHDPDAAGEALKTLGPKSGIQIGSIVDSISREDPESAQLWAIDYAPPRMQRSIIIDSATELDDPAAIQRVYEKLEGVKWQGAYMQHQLMNWNDRSIEGGLEWILSTPPERREHWIRELGNGIGKTQFNAAMELASDVDDPELRNAFEYGLIYSLSSSDFERAVQLAEKSGNRDLIDETIAWGAYRHADNDYYAPEDIAAYAKRVVNSTYYNDIVSDLLRRWYPQDPDAALGWFETLEGNERSGAIWSLASTMTFRDPDAALDWADNLTKTEDRDRALPAVLNSLASKNPEKAFTLAASLSNGQARIRETGDAIRIWARREPDKAKEAILSNAHLSEKEKQRLIVRIYGAQ